MERLTKRCNGVVTYIGKENSYDTGQIAAEMNTAARREILERLGAYEDTERRPEEVQALNRLFDYALKESRMLQKQLALIERLRELAEADKDGRLVVLPRVPGLTLTNRNELYIIDEDEGEIYSDGLYGAEIGVNSEGRVAVNFTTLDFHLFYDEDIGKTVFLTREEAEKALERKG